MISSIVHDHMTKNRINLAEYREEQATIAAAKKRKTKRPSTVPNTARGVEITSADFLAGLTRTEATRDKEAAEKAAKSAKRQASILRNKQARDAKEALKKAEAEASQKEAAADALNPPVPPAVPAAKKRTYKKRKTSVPSSLFLPEPNAGAARMLTNIEAAAAGVIQLTNIEVEQVAAV